MQKIGRKRVCEFVMTANFKRERERESMEYKVSNIENTLKGKNINYLIIEISYQENNTLSLVLFAVNDLRKSNNERC